MREEVFKIHKYPLGHKVDKQLLVSIKDIFLQYDEHMFLKLKQNVLMIRHVFLWILMNVLNILKKRLIEL